jgi:hypothetical protein
MGVESLAGACFGDGALELAVFLVASQVGSVSLGGLLDEERAAAFRAGLGDWFVPNGEVAVGVVAATVEELPAS